VSIFFGFLGSRYVDLGVGYLRVLCDFLDVVCDVLCDICLCRNFVYVMLIICVKWVVVVGFVEFEYCEFGVVCGVGVFVVEVVVDFEDFFEVVDCCVFEE